mgnify:CR=1 FL=1
MKKALVCLLAITLVLFVFTACDNKTPTPDTGSNTGGSVSEPTIPDSGTTTAPKATTEQLFLLQELYRQSFLNMDDTIEGVSLDNDVYTFSDVDIDDAYNDFEGTLSGTFKDTKTEISINLSFEDVKGKTYTVSGTIERNGKNAEITINGDKCLIHKYQVPPYQDPTQTIPEATTNQFNIYTKIFLDMNSINTSTTPPEGFTKVNDSYFIYENVKVLGEDGNEKGILNGIVIGGAYLNITYEEAKGEINTIISFFEQGTEPKIFIVFINGEACTVALG